MGNNDQPFYLVKNAGFGTINAEDDLLHPKANSTVTDDSCTETQYFGFSIPEERIHAITYLWHHPKLKLVSGGLCVFQGFKNRTMEGELVDMRTFMSDRVLDNDLHEFRFESGYGVKVIEPLKKFHLTYADPARKHSVDLHFEAVLPPVMFADNLHFEQAMKVTGSLTLRGKPYTVDCYNVRDRSWGKPRREDVMNLPPMSWMTGVFNDSFAFNCTVMDQASQNLEIKGRFEMPEEQTFNSGWIQRDGKTGCIVKATKRVVRAPKSMLPLSIDLEATDDLGRTMVMRGTLIAGLPYPQSWNNTTLIGLMRWECDGMIAHGDCQEGYWNDYLNYMAAQ